MPSTGRRSSADAPAHIVHSLAVLGRAYGLRHLQATRNQLRRRPQTGSVPGRTTAACGGRGDPKAASASRPAQGRSRRKSSGPGTKKSDRPRRQGQRGGTCAAHSQRLHQRRAGFLRRHNAVAEAAAPVDTGLDLARLNFRYAIEGDTPAWRPLRAFDDGAKVFIEFPRGIRQGEMPPLFVLGHEGGAELVNYRARQNYYVVDRLFAAAELRLGGDHQQKVRIVRTDGRPRW